MPREEIKRTHIENAVRITQSKLKARLLEKGNLTLSNTHEIFGILGEEMDELSEALHQNDLDAFYEELLDVAVACVFGMACIKQGALDW